MCSYILGEGWLGFPDLCSGQKPWWNRYFTPVLNFSEVRRVQLTKSTLLTYTLVLLGSAPGNFSDLLTSDQMIKREWGAESNGKSPHLSIPTKTAVWVPEIAVEDLPLSRTAALIPVFAVKDLPLSRILWWRRRRWWWWWWSVYKYLFYTANIVILLHRFFFLFKGILENLYFAYVKYLTLILKIFLHIRWTYRW